MAEELGINVLAWAFMLSTFGAVLYSYSVFMFAKDEVDGTRKKFSWSRYKEEHWDNWVWAIMLIPVMAIFAEQIWKYTMEYFEKDWPFYDVIYLCTGVLAEGLRWAMKKGKSVIGALKNGNK